MCNVSAMNGTEIAGPGTRLEPTPLVYRLPVVGRMLGGLSRRTVSNLIACGELEAIPVGATRMVPHESIVAYLERQRRKAEAGEVTYYGSRKKAKAAA